MYSSEFGGIVAAPLRHCGTAPLLIHQIKALAQAGEHAQAQDVDLEHPRGVDVVLVPLDDRAARHGGVLDGDQLAQRGAGDDEPPDVLRAVAREAQELRGERHEPSQRGVVGVQAQGAQA